MSQFPNNQPQQRPKTALSNRSLVMWAPNGTGKSAMMTVDIKKNEVVVAVRTNVPDDANNDHGRIVAAMPVDMFYATMQMLRQAAISDKPVRWAYEHRDKKFIGQGRMTDGPVLHYRIVVGKGEDNIVYWSITADKRPNIKFTFAANNKTGFKDNDGNEMDRGLESSIITMGKVRYMEKMVAIVIEKNYVHPEQKPFNGQGGGGGQGGQNNRGNGGGQGGNSSYGGSGANTGGGTTMASDDIMW